MKTIAFFHPRDGVGKTLLVYHLAWMFHELGTSVVAADLDPQASLTAAFLSPERLETIAVRDCRPVTVFGAVRPLLERSGDIVPADVELVESSPLWPTLALVLGDLGLTLFEDRLAEAWPRCLSDDLADAHDGFRVMSSLHRVVKRAAEDVDAELALIDVGPNLGAIHRAALVASDYVVVPLGADSISLQGLRYLGPTLRRWREGWAERLAENVPAGLDVPAGAMAPAGYVAVQHSTWGSPPVKAFDRWLRRFPTAFHGDVLGEAAGSTIGDPDPELLGAIRNYSHLMPMTREARKPMFALRPADGAFGSHAAAVMDCRRDFESLARRIARECGIALPS